MALISGKELTMVPVARDAQEKEESRDSTYTTNTALLRMDSQVIVEFSTGRMASSPQSQFRSCASEQTHPP